MYGARTRASLRQPLVWLVLATWGVIGCQGPTGPQGPPGSTGAQGPDGPPGPTGADAAVSLVTTTPVDRGDSNCPFGGVLVQTGLDDGSGGGTAGDGVLQPGEVDTSSYVCNTATTVQGYEPPGGARGTGVIDVSGGASTDSGSGGSGGSVQLVARTGTGGGALEAFATGTADASFTMPDMTAYVDLGPHPLVASSGTTYVLAVDTPDEASAGQFYFFRLQWPSAVFLRDPIHGDHEMTGLDVAAGATVEFEADDAWGPPGFYAPIAFGHDVHNAGTITTSTFSPSGFPQDFRGGLTLNCANFISEPGSAIDMSGPDEQAGNYGGEGGFLDLVAGGGGYSTSYGPIGSIYNQGDIDARGGASPGAVSGRGGDVALDASDRIYNLGDISTSASTATTTEKSPGAVTLYGTEGLYNSGDIDASAPPMGAYGAEGRTIHLESVVEVRNSGDLVSRGGDSTSTDCTDCGAGSGGEVSLVAGGAGGVVSSGTIDVRGGDGADGAAGSGGAVSIGTLDGYSPQIQTEDPGDVRISGDILASGGSSPLGGADGGTVDLWVDPGDHFDGQQVLLFGYDRVVLDGGDAGPNGGYGGDGGDYEMSQSPTTTGEPGGAVVNYADVHATGGLSYADNTGGGTGGSVSFWTDDTEAFRGTSAVALNAGDVDLSGGSGLTTGGDAGCFQVFGANQSENAGDLVIAGGDATDTAVANAASGGGFGCRASTGVYSSLGPATNTGSIDTHGGAATGTDAGYGGEGGAVEVVGASVDNTGSLSTRGGDGGSVDGTGGNGGKVFFRSFDAVTGTVAGFDTTAGSGATGGLDGPIWVDGVNVSPDYQP